MSSSLILGAFTFTLLGDIHFALAPSLFGPFSSLFYIIILVLNDENFLRYSNSLIL